MTNLPVRCVRCVGIHVITTKATDPETGELRWRYRCLDCAVAWWVDDHGGAADDYVRRNRP